MMLIESDPKIQIYVFSFNRGIFLRNCLESIRNCIPQFPINIIDDYSDDDETLSILSEWSNEANVIKIKPVKDNAFIGGLQNNMNFAFQHAFDHKAEFALFIQDDQQIVRKLTERDLDAFYSFFSRNASSFQLHTCFMKLSKEKFDNSNTYLDSSGKAYFRPLNGKLFAGFCDTGLYKVDRFFEFVDKLVTGQEIGETAANIVEKVNNDIFESKKIQMGIYAYPFMMFLPMAISYRDKSRDPVHWLIEKLGGAGFYPYELMKKEEIEKLFERDLSERPYAENYLTCHGVEDLKIWAFSGGITITSHRGGLIKFLGITLNSLNIWRKFKKLNSKLKYTNK